jgi:RNA-directed DNA polymerase
MRDGHAEMNPEMEEHLRGLGYGIPEDPEGGHCTLTAGEEQLFPDSICLMEEVVRRANMLKSYKRVMTNKGAAGVDGVTVEELRDYLKAHWERIRGELLRAEYKPQPVRRVDIPKSGGGSRMLGVPTVIDRLIQQAVLQVLGPIFDRGFSESSYGFRPGRSAQQAVLKARKYIMAGRRWVVDIDLSKFFDRVNHDILMSRVSRKVKDKRVLRLIGSFLRAGISHEGEVESRREGTPQGGPLSPLLANILLDDLDKELERRNHKFCRYADDCNIYVRSQQAGERVMASVTEFLEKKLKLKVNRDKSDVDRPWKRKFLGYTVLSHKDAKLKPAPESLKRARRNLKEIFHRGRGRNMERVIADVNRFTIGWVHYFRHSDVRGVFSALDEWIRRRLRAIIWRQWKRRWTRFRELVKRGLAEERARMSAFNDRGPCWNSGKSHMNQAFPIVWFDNRGLVKLSKLHRDLCLSGTAVYKQVCTVV